MRTAPTDKAASKELTLAVDAERTRVTVGEIVEQKDQNDGRVVTKLRTRPGTLADLKAGQRVRVQAAGDVATAIDIVPVPPGRQGRKRPAEGAGRQAK